MLEDEPPNPEEEKPWNATKYVTGLASGGGKQEVLGQALGWNDQTSWLDKAQDVVSLVGIVDPTGIADVANALVYGARGEFGDAAISLAGVVPLAGDVFKLGKFARGTAKAARSGKATAKTAHVGAAAAKADAKVVGNVEKAATGAGKVRGKVGRAFEKGKKYYEKGKKLKGEFDRRFGDRGKGQGEPDGDAPAPEEPETAQPEVIEPQEVPPPKPEGRLARKTIDDEKPEQPPPDEPPTDEPPTDEPSKPAFTRKTAGGSTDQKPHASGAGGSARTPSAGRPMAPVGGQCPTPDTKTSQWGAKKGFKRCHPQTPGRDH